MQQKAANTHEEVYSRLTAYFTVKEEALNGRSQQPYYISKREAFDQLGKTPFPDRKNEDWKYTPVSRIIGPAYKPAPVTYIEKVDLEAIADLGIDTQKLVFVNGYFQKDLSDIIPEGIGLEVLTIERALENDTLKDRVLKSIEVRKEKMVHAFQWMNLAFNSDGLFIHVEANRVIEKPLEIIFVTKTSDTELMQHPQLLVHQDMCSQLTIIERHVSLSDEMESLTNAFHSFSLEANASLYHRKIQHAGMKTNIVNHTDIRQAKDSQYHGFTLDLGGKTVRNNLYAHLEGENTETHLLGAYLPHDRQSMDNQTFIDHAFPNCYSNEKYKGIVADRSKAVFNGKVLVRPDAQKTNAFQQNSNLVLSPYAVVDTKPQLEIFADDVKCSHGATIGQLEEEAIFYLRSRGLSLQDSKSLLQEAFVGEVFLELKEEEIRVFVRKLIREQLAEISNG